MRVPWVAGVEVLSTPIPATAVSERLYGRACLLVGLALTESTGLAAAVVELSSNPAGVEPALCTINLGAGESVRESYPPFGFSFGGGLFLTVAAGSVIGVAWLVDGGRGD